MHVSKFALADLLSYNVAFISVNEYFESPLNNLYRYNAGTFNPYIEELPSYSAYIPAIAPKQCVTITLYDPTFNRTSLDASGESPDDNTHDVKVYLNLDISTVNGVVRSYIQNHQYLMNHKWFNSPFWPYYSATTWWDTYGEAKVWFALGAAGGNTFTDLTPTMAWTISYYTGFDTSGLPDLQLSIADFFALKGLSTSNVTMAQILDAAGVPTTLLTLGKFLNDVGVSNFAVSSGSQHWEWNGTSRSGQDIPYDAGLITSSYGYGIGFSNTPLGTFISNPYLTWHGRITIPDFPSTATGGTGGTGGGESSYTPPTLSGTPPALGPVSMQVDLSAYTTTVNFNLLKSTSAVYDQPTNTTTITETITLYPRSIYLVSVDIVDSPIGNGYKSVDIVDTAFSAPTTVTFNTWYTLRTVPPTAITGVYANVVYSVTTDAWGNVLSAQTGFPIKFNVVMKDATHPNMALRYNFIDTAGYSFSYVSSEPLIEVNVGTLNSKYQLGTQVPLVNDPSGAAIPDYYGTKTTQGTNKFLSNLVYVGEGHGPV